MIDPFEPPFRNHSTAATAGDLISRAAGLLAEWEETPNEGDPMIDVLLGVIREALGLLRALPAAPASAGVTVEPLVWEAHDDKYDGGRSYYGNGIFGHWYCVSRLKSKCWMVVHHIGGEVVHMGPLASQEAAKAAAQADYERRILAAIPAAAQGATSCELCGSLIKEGNCFCNWSPAQGEPVASDVAELIEYLQAGVHPCGLHDDNSTEIYLVDDASEKMFEAAQLIKRLQSPASAGVTVKVDPEGIAKLVYDAMVWACYAGPPPQGNESQWVPGGNSLGQTEARSTAARILAALTQPAPVSGPAMSIHAGQRGEVGE